GDRDGLRETVLIFEHSAGIVLDTHRHGKREFCRRRKRAWKPQSFDKLSFFFVFFCLKELFTRAQFHPRPSFAGNGRCKFQHYRRDGQTGASCFLTRAAYLSREWRAHLEVPDLGSFRTWQGAWLPRGPHAGAHFQAKLCLRRQDPRATQQRDGVWVRRLGHIAGIQELQQIFPRRRPYRYAFTHTLDDASALLGNGLGVHGRVEAQDEDLIFIDGSGGVGAQVRNGRRSRVKFIMHIRWKRVPLQGFKFWVCMSRAAYPGPYSRIKNVSPAP